MAGKHGAQGLQDSGRIRHVVRIFAQGRGNFGAQVGGKHDDRVAEAYLGALAVSEHALVKHLVEELHDIRMGFFHFVKQDN